MLWRKVTKPLLHKSRNELGKEHYLHRSTALFW